MVSPALPRSALKNYLTSRSICSRMFAQFSLVNENLFWEDKREKLVMPVTAKQKRIFEFIRRYIESNQEAPTIAEIGRQFQMRSSASVHAVLTALEREGLIKRIPNVSRGIEIVQQKEGKAAARGTMRSLYWEPWLPASRLKQFSATTLSPFPKICRDTDVLCPARSWRIDDRRKHSGWRHHHRHVAKNCREWTDGSRAYRRHYATVKKFYREPDFIRLEPANPQFKPIFIKTPERIQIQGVVRGLIRRFAA